MMPLYFECSGGGPGTYNTSKTMKQIIRSLQLCGFMLRRQSSWYFQRPQDHEKDYNISVCSMFSRYSWYLRHLRHPPVYVYVYVYAYAYAYAYVYVYVHAYLYVCVYVCVCVCVYGYVYVGAYVCVCVYVYVYVFTMYVYSTTHTHTPSTDKLRSRNAPKTLTRTIAYVGKCLRAHHNSTRWPGLPLANPK